MKAITRVTRYEFTERELLVIRMTAEGYTNRDIARALNRHEMTVKNILSHIYAALELDTTRNPRVLLARMARDAGLVEPMDDEALLGFLPKGGA